jgi:hypothetical protein
MDPLMSAKKANSDVGSIALSGHEEISSLHVRIVSRSTLRIITRDVSEDGPLAERSQFVFNVVTQCAKETMSSNQTLDIFFYDIWAERCSNLGPGDVISIAGPSSMVYPLSESKAEDSHPCCIVVSEYVNTEGSQIEVNAELCSSKKPSTSMS